MYHVFRVHIYQCLCYLLYIVRSGFLIKPFVRLLLQGRVKLTPCSVLKDQVYFLLIVEVAIEFQDIRVVQIGLDFNFSEDLLLGIRLFQVRFIHYFECDNEVEFLFSCDVHGSVFPSSETFPYYKIILGPLPSLPNPINNIVLMSNNDFLVLLLTFLRLQ